MPGLPWGSLGNEVQRLGSNEYIEVRRALSRLATSGVNGDAKGSGSLAACKLNGDAGLLR